jgi:hypothetical protein
MLVANHGRKSRRQLIPNIKISTKKRRFPLGERRLIDRDT